MLSSDRFICTTVKLHPTTAWEALKQTSFLKCYSKALPLPRRFCDAVESCASGSARPGDGNHTDPPPPRHPEGRRRGETGRGGERLPLKGNRLAV